MSRLLLSRQTVRTVLDLLATLIRETLPGTTGAGVTLVDAAGKRTTAASDPIVARADALQYELDEGPCLSAARYRRPVRIEDLELDQRWPRWSEQAAGLGLRSMVSTHGARRGVPRRDQGLLDPPGDVRAPRSTCSTCSPGRRPRC